MVQLNFDATQVAPDMGQEVLPSGWYNVLMDESDLKPTKDGSGTMLVVRFSVIDGQYSGRKLFSRLNIKNTGANGAQTMEIAYKQLSAIAHAVGVLHVGQTEQLHGIPLKVKVKIRIDKSGEYEPQNDIISYKNINEPIDAAGGAPALGGFTGAPAAFVAPGAPAGFAPPTGFAPPPAFAPPAPTAPPAPIAGPQRPADPSHIHAAGTPGEQWWINGAWTPAVQAPPAPVAPPTPTAPAGTWAPPGDGQQPWAGGAAAGFAAPPAGVPAGGPAGVPAPAAPHATQAAPPPWVTQPAG